MRLLINCDREKLTTKIDVTVLRQLEHVKKIHPEAFYCGNGWGIDLEAAHVKYKPDIVLFGADYDYNDWILAPNYQNTIKVMYMQDYWFDIDKRRQILQHGCFDALITKNYAGTEMYRSWFPNVQFYVNPSGFDEDIFYPTYEDKRYDVLICGLLNESVYPQRVRLANIAKKLSDKMVVYEKPHCGWFKAHNHIDNQTNFAKYINQSKLVISGTANLGVYMQKTWEISACSSVCITDTNPNEPEFELISKHVKSIDMSLSDNEIADIYLDQIANFDYNVTQQYNAVVYSYATLHYRTSQLLQLIRTIHDKGSHTQT